MAEIQRWSSKNQNVHVVQQSRSGKHGGRDRFHILVGQKRISLTEDQLFNLTDTLNDACDDLEAE